MTCKDCINYKMFVEKGYTDETKARYELLKLLRQMEKEMVMQ